MSIFEIVLGMITAVVLFVGIVRANERIGLIALGLLFLLGIVAGLT